MNTKNEQRAADENAATPEAKNAIGLFSAKALELIGGEVKAVSELKAGIEKATGDVWNGIRDALRGVLADHGYKAAGLALEAFKGAAIQTGDDTVAGRAKQYASNLNRAVKAVKDGKDIPAELWTCTRPEWNETSEGPGKFWADAGILSKSGAKSTKAGEKAKAGEKPASVGDAAEDAVKDEALAEVMALLAQLDANFRKDALARIKDMLTSQLAKQVKATGGTK